jgi:hypothetical protein
LREDEPACQFLQFSKSNVAKPGERMKVTIDNLDGRGPIDYTRALCADSGTDSSATITRRLNEPTLAQLRLDCTSTNLAIPAVNAWVVITAENGAYLFTGYLPNAAEPVFAGYSSTGPVYRYLVNAVSEDWLLNREAVPQTAPLLGLSAGNMIRTVTNRVNPSLVQMNGLEDVGTIGFFEPMPNVPWSQNVAALANQARSAYRVLNGQLTLAPVGSTVHAMTDRTGTLQFSPLNAAEAKQVVNDVTLTGLAEPIEYVTELFQGDGATVLFQLRRQPFRIVRPILLDEEFTTATLNPSVWQVNDAGGYMNVSGAGLTLTGGSGTDGTTTLTAIDPLELGGEVVIESGFVTLNAGSDGVVCGIYAGTVNLANCIAGFRVRSSGSNTILVPLVNGVEVGTEFTVQSGHSYILRLHAHSQELQRVLNSYFSYGANGPEVYGGGTVAAPLQLLFELQDMALLPYVNIGSTILYDGSLSTSPAIGTFACIDSVNLQGSFGYFKITRPGTVWVVSMPASGAPFTRRIGQANQGADCNVLRDGFLHFYKLAIPQPGEILAVTYRVAGPSVARLASANAQGGGAPAVSQWVGHVLQPPARSGVDCENACQALLNFSSNPAAAWKGEYRYFNLQDGQDIWPGDALDFSASGAGLTANVIVRSVTIHATSSYPEVLEYRVAFANDWAETIAMKLTNAISPDVLLPPVAETAPGSYLENLNALEIVSISTTEIAVNANITPPQGGGFEVRSLDFTFGADTHEDRVLRSPVASFTITRSADQEQFYIRMYDGSTPPLYSRLSAVILTDVPTS